MCLASVSCNFNEDKSVSCNSMTGKKEKQGKATHEGHRLSLQLQTNERKRQEMGCCEGRPQRPDDDAAPLDPAVRAI